METKVFVEGDCNKRLLEDYIKYLSLEEKFKVIHTGGKDKLKEQVPTIKGFNDQEFKALVVFDADSDIEKRIKELNKIKAENDVLFDVFLFPNNADNGTIEDLLLKIYNTDYHDVFDCRNGYENCLKKNKSYKVPIKKCKIYGFLDAVLPEAEEDNAKDKKRDFINYDHWNLAHDYLETLKEFLTEQSK